jgi:endonuclease YncB( thermonuclease family)
VRVDTDRYGRTVALCSVGDPDLSLAMVRGGHAVEWCYYIRKNRHSMLATFQMAEAKEKKERRGIWARGSMRWRDWRC